MQILTRVILIVLVVMTIGAGVPKIVQMPQELGFLAHLGLQPWMVSALGVVQLIGGVLLVPSRTRLAGAALALGAFLVSAGAIFQAGQIAFGVLSLLPVAGAAVVIWDSVTSAPQGASSV